MNRALIPALAILATLSACDGSPTAEVVVSDPASAMDAINAVETSQLTAFDADDVEGATAVYAPDATFIASGMPLVSGIEAIRAAFDEMLADPSAKLEMTPTGNWVSNSGDYATTTSTYVFTHATADGTVVSENGFNQTLWHKAGDTWQIVVDSNTSLPAPEAAPATPATDAPAIAR